MPDLRFDNRGVSELIGFVMVFGLIVGSVGVMYYVGFDSMSVYQQGEQVRNADRAMDAFAQNLNELQRNDGIVTRSSEINPRGSTLSVDGESTDLEVVVEDSSGTIIETIPIELGALNYKMGRRTIGYEAGGVYRNQSGTSLAIREPMVSCKNDSASDAAIISLVDVEGDPPVRSTTDPVEIRAVKTDVETKTFDSSNMDVTIDVDDSPYEVAWENALEQRGFDGSGKCSDVDRITIRITTVEIDY